METHSTYYTTSTLIEELKKMPTPKVMEIQTMLFILYGECKEKKENINYAKIAQILIEHSLVEPVICRENIFYTKSWKNYWKKLEKEDQKNYIISRKQAIEIEINKFSYLHKYEPFVQISIIDNMEFVQIAEKNSTSLININITGTDDTKICIDFIKQLDKQ